MRALLPLVALVVAACASSGGAPTGRATETVRIDGVGTLNMAGASTTASVTSLAYPIDQAWAALRTVYDSLAIPVTTQDPATHTIANDGFKIRNRLGKTALSRYVECGNTQMGPSADSYEVYLSVTTHLKPADAGNTSVESTVEATARPVQFAQAPSRCTSKGELETRIATQLRTALAQPKR
ncbi:hypothetical protein J421_1749 [Gemmatirosa kalamazoonensis]|uniref:Lipoprotein n=1 Tax=Gemmatirosa kalamazoonensis TaxID=861299 RepID=W0RES9_9BACT|nr:hypothetical protein [Gemmatirosa kalamazoonensis]AHG89286.1 hypothetical protein J421_1749 [Gemmatirosa kalamazoonensis]